MISVASILVRSTYWCLYLRYVHGRYSSVSVEPQITDEDHVDLRIYIEQP